MKAQKLFWSLIALFMAVSISAQTPDSTNATHDSIKVTGDAHIGGYLITKHIKSPDGTVHIGDSSMTFSSFASVSNPIKGGTFAMEAQSTSTSSSNIGIGWGTNTAAATRAFALGLNTKAYGDNSMAFGNIAEADADWSAAFGYNTKVGSSATYAIALGSGYASGPMLNNTSQSLAVGFNSTVPTLFVTGGNGTSGSLGNVGIGTTTLNARLSVYGDAIFAGTSGTPTVSAYINGNSNNSTASTPDYTWYSDLTTGMFHPAANVIAFSKAGSEVMRVHSNGNVGINTTSPSYTLDVTGNARITGALTSGATTVSSLTNSGTMSSGATSVTSFTNSGNTTLSGSLSSGATTITSFTNTGSSLFSGSMKNTTYTVGPSGKRIMEVDETGLFSVLAAGTSSQVLYGNGAWGSLPAQTFTLSGSNAYFTGGKVGIGTSTPSYSLDVSGDIRATGTITGGATSVTSFTNSGNTTLSGSLSSGAATVSSLASSGAISGGATTVASFTSTGAIHGGATTVSSLTSNGDVIGGSTSVSSLTSSGAISGGATTVTSFTSTGAIHGGATTVSSLTSSGVLTAGTTTVSSLTSTGVVSSDSVKISSLAGTGYRELYADDNGNLRTGNPPPGNTLLCSTSLNWNIGGNLIGGYMGYTPAPAAGTCDNYDFVLKAYNTDYVWLKPSGKLGLGTSSPATMFDIQTGGTKDGLNILNGTTSIFSVNVNGSTTINDLDAVQSNPLLSMTHSSGSTLNFLANGSGDIASSTSISLHYGVTNTTDNFAIYQGTPGSGIQHFYMDKAGSSYFRTTDGTGSNTAFMLVNNSNSSGTGTDKNILIVNNDGSTMIPSLNSTGVSSTGPYSELLVDANGKLVSKGQLPSGTSSSSWDLGGNTGTGTFPGNALGTTDSQDLVFITGGTATTNERLRIRATDGHVVLNQKQLILTGPTDPSSGLGVFPFGVFYTSASNPITVNGPILYGYDGGALGSNTSGSFGGITRIALRWNDAGQVVVGAGIPQGNHSDATFAVYGKTLLTSAFVNINPAVWADYVFDKNYKLMPLSDVETYYLQNKHLPEVPSTKDMAEKGDNLGETDALLLKKIEELTMYVVELEKQVKELKAKSNKN